MARIRTLKPEFWQDEKLSPLPPLERLVFLGLLSMADDAGRLVDNVKAIDGMLFPHTDDTSRDAIETLARLKRVCRYTAESGQKCIQILGWAKHQKVDNPAKHVLPAPTPQDLERQPDTKSSRESREDQATSSRSDLGPRTLDHGPRIMDHPPQKPSGGKMPDRAVDPLETPAFARPPARTGRPKRAPLTPDEEAVLDHYAIRHPKRQKPHNDPKMRRVVRRALTELGYSVEKLCKAIDGNADDPWYRERKKHDLTLVLRDTGQIDNFIATAEKIAEDEIPILIKDPARAHAMGIVA